MGSAALALVDWPAALAFLAGGLLALGALALTRPVGGLLLVVAGAGIAAVALVTLVAHAPAGPTPGITPGSHPTYDVAVRTAAGDAFDVTIDLDDDEAGTGVRLAGLRAASVPGRGLLSRQVVIPGPAARPGLCDPRCPGVRLRFVDVPAGSIWQVRHGLVDAPLVSGDTEVVTATIAGEDVDAFDIQFSYFPEPFSAWRPYLGPIAGATSLPAVLVALLGTMANGIWLLALGAAEAAVLDLLRRVARRRPAPPAPDRPPAAGPQPPDRVPPTPGPGRPRRPEPPRRG
jgi:hypothetical protein